PELANLGQWFSMYGKPKQVPDGYISSFVESPKIYGGTNHHRAFSSQAMTMTKGRLTR
ncbi:unnamed protein product, partial [Chrysoparadoxa australica]